MHRLKSLSIRFPAARWALLVALGVSGLSFLVLRLIFADRRPSVFLVGDSGIGNYRLDRGSRLHDQVERTLGGKVGSYNWAEPGARTGDFYLQYAFGTLLAGTPRYVVVALSPDKLLCDGPQSRFDDDGRNLRWIPWTRGGLRYWRNLEGRERSLAVVQQVGAFLFGEYDLARMAWIQLVQWPSQRGRMRTGGPERRHRIECKFEEKVASFERGAGLSDSAIEARQIVKDFELSVRAFRDDGVQPLVVLLPTCNPDLARRILPAASLAQRDTIDAKVRRWLDRQGLQYIDYNLPDRIAQFPDSSWDDAEHLKKPESFGIVAADIGGWVSAQQSPAIARNQVLGGRNGRR